MQRVGDRGVPPLLGRRGGIGHIVGVMLAMWCVRLLLQSGRGEGSEAQGEEKGYVAHAE